jgi:hypothetical protein
MMKTEQKRIRPIRARVLANTGEVAMLLTTDNKMMLVHRGTSEGCTDCFRDEFIQRFVVGVDFWGATDGESFRYDVDATTPEASLNGGSR